MAARCSSRRRPQRSQSLRCCHFSISENTASRTSPRQNGSSSSAQGEFPPLKSLYRTNLPVPTTAMVGRELELAEIVELLQREDRPLLTLSGPGGTGKTRLAIQSAAEASESYADGVWWVSLAPLRDAHLLVSSLADALQVEEQPGRDLAKSLAERLDGKRALLLLDNAEHLLPAVAHEIARLRDVAGPTILVTSRERLQLQGEHVYAVPTLADDQGVELFMTRARALEPAVQTSQVVVGALLASGQPAAGTRARGRPDRRLLSGAASRAAFPTARPAQGGPRRRPTPADSPSDHRVVVRPPRRHRAETLSSALGLRGRLCVRIRRGGRIGRSRHTSVAARQEPASPQRESARPALLDARDDPRARSREARGGGGDGRDPPPSRGALPHPRSLGQPRRRSGGPTATRPGHPRARQLARGTGVGTGDRRERAGARARPGARELLGDNGPAGGRRLGGSAARRRLGRSRPRCSCGLCASRVAWRTCSVRSTSP